jgi:hypothetical protein
MMDELWWEKELEASSSPVLRRLSSTSPFPTAILTLSVSVSPMSDAVVYAISS